MEESVKMERDISYCRTTVIQKRNLNFNLAPIVTMNINSKQVDTVWYIGTSHESHYGFIGPSSGQLSILSPYSALSDCSGQQSPCEYHNMHIYSLHC